MEGFAVLMAILMPALQRVKKQAQNTVCKSNLRQWTTMFVMFTQDVDASNDDLTLQAASPAIDGGNPAGIFDDADGSNNDQGAYGGPLGAWP